MYIMRLFGRDVELCKLVPCNIIGGLEALLAMVDVGIVKRFVGWGVRFAKMLMLLYFS